MHQTTLERIEQELKKIKRQLQCGTQFFDTVEEFPEVGVPCAIYVDKSSGAFYVYDTLTSTYITADAGEDVDFSLTTTGTSGPATLVGTILNIPQYQSVLTNPVTGTGTAGQVSYWSGTGTQTGSANLTYDNTLRQLKVTGATANYILDLTTTSNSVAFRFEENSVLCAGLQYIGSTFSIANRRQYLELIGTNGIAFRSTGGELGRFNGGNFLLNSTTDNGQRLQVYGSTLLQGSGTTSATTALLVQNSDAANLLRVRNDGALIVGLRTSEENYIAGYTSTSPFGVGQRTLAFVFGTLSGTRPNPAFYFTSASNINFTSASGDFIQTSFTFNPTSGTGIINTHLISPTINQTGGANGITRGLYVNPTLTAAADWRSIEWSNNTGWGLYGAGTAANYLAGNTSIGTTTSGGRLTVQGSGTTSATTALQVRNSSGSIITSILDDGRIVFGTSVASIRLVGNELTLASNAAGTAAGNDFTFGSGQGNVGTTSGTFNSILIRFGPSQSFNPTSGTGVFNVINIPTTINQTGGANGITRGLYVNPTLTAAADWRGVEITTSTVNTVVLGKNTGSAAVEVTSTTQGFLPPRLTTAQRNLIASPAAGLVIFNTTTTKLECFDGAVWQAAW